MMYIPYLLAFLALVVAIISVVGETRTPNRLLPLGWVLVIAAVVIFLLNAKQYYHQQKNLNQLEGVACTEILRGVHGLISPFTILLADIDLRTKKPGTGQTKLNYRIEKFQRLKEHELSSTNEEIFKDLLFLHNHKRLISSYLFTHYTLVLNQKRGPRWIDLFRTTAFKGIDTIDTTLSSYRSVLSTDSVSALQRFRNSWLTQRVENLSKLQEKQQKELSVGGYFRLSDIPNAESDKILDDFLNKAKVIHSMCAQKIK